MSDLPPGQYSELLVGPVWVGDTSLEFLSGAAARFGENATALDHYGDQLRQAWTGALAGQRGVTAEDARAAFQQGERRARELADKYHTKQTAFTTAHGAAGELQSALATIAADGNARIQAIQHSKEPAPIQLEQMVDVVLDCQTRANTRAAACGGSIFDAIQSVLDKEGVGTSARQFTTDNGVDTARAFGSPERASVHDQVQTLVQRIGSPQSPEPDIPTPGTGPRHFESGATPDAPSVQESQPPQHFTDGAVPETPASPPTQTVEASQHFTSGTATTPTTPPTQPPATPTTPVPAAQPGAPPSGPPATPSPTASSPPAPVATPTLPTTAPTTTPLHGFETSTAPPSSPWAGTPIVSPAEPPAPSTHPTPHVQPPLAAGHAPVTPPVDTAPAPAPETTPTYLAAPAVPATPPAPSIPAPAGSLPAYGADLRPSASAPTAPAGPAAPASAPVTPAAGNVGQPALVRQPSTPTPTAVAEQAVAATGTGAAAGTVAATATARTRLQLLVDAVARQEPRLRWAAGDRPDGTTVLVTDLACGWIPPHVDIPTGLRLLDPARRRGDADALLPETTVRAGYAPGDYLPTDADPVPTSPRARRAPAVDDLGFELGRATRWRDGLPRLAHTLARAAWKGTGVLDSEIDLLAEYLGTVSAQVLQTYPDGADATKLGNWQLLAAIDALAGGDSAVAGYHFAWFQALTAETEGST